jgi:hypothetical protein
MSERLWWQKPLRVIQYNLQVKDTPHMDPARIAEETEKLHANALVVNVGGIYAWYQSDIPYHHVNEYLPKDFDLLGELLKECHARDIKVFARYDFSKNDDAVFQAKPRWFVRRPDASPRIIGRDRMGEWSLLVSTCVNSGYRDREFAIPVMLETLARYPIDGIFFNGPQLEPCWCEACREKYAARYGCEIPDNAADFDPDWRASCMNDSMSFVYSALKERAPELPVVLYYYPGGINGGRTSSPEGLMERYQFADMICAEAQNVLARGVTDLPSSWSSAVNAKVGASAEGRPKPFGIIHSSPGMEWRHTGMPPAEYRYWLSLVPANGGTLWHSLTGFPDTISDKRVLSAVEEVNRRVMLSEEHMDTAKSAAQVLLLWNAGPSAEGWVEGLHQLHTQFDLLPLAQLTRERLAAYQVVICPEGTALSEDAVAALTDYVVSGGGLIQESARPSELKPLAAVTGVEIDIAASEELAASYIRLEPSGALLKGFEQTPLLPHRGKVAYCEPLPDRKTLATLVPPFAPREAVGAPPERASILTPQTDIPLCVSGRYGAGMAVLLPFSLGALTRECRMADHYRLMYNCVCAALDGPPRFQMRAPAGVTAALYRSGRDYLLHLVNGVGARPLASNVAVTDLSFTLALDAPVANVSSVIEQAALEFRAENGVLHCRIDKLELWDMIQIELREH